MAKFEKRQVGLALLLLVVAVAALQPTTKAITPSNTWTYVTSSSTTKQTVSVVSYSTWLQSVTKTMTSMADDSISQTSLTTTSDPVTAGVQSTTTSHHETPDCPAVTHQERLQSENQ